MSLILSDREIGAGDRARVGGKAAALAALARAGFPVPGFLAVTTEAYGRFLSHGGLRERLQRELHRKEFPQMRWEELWDCAARIRHLFLRHPFPGPLAEELGRALGARFGDRPAAVRSSAPEEDAAAASFAGLHDSYLDLIGPEALLEHIRKVWASLWSDAALMYRRELGLDPERSAMAVVVQEMVRGERSGIVFSQGPNAPSQAVVEACFGLNQELVDGRVAPYRWIVDRDFDRILASQAPEGPAGTAAPPLDPAEVLAVYRLARRAEAHFGAPQDVEWTIRAGRLFMLQSRPVTAAAAAGEDPRAWYRSLHRSFENLKAMRRRIEEEHLPALERDAAALAAVDLAALDDGELAREIERRHEMNQAWVDVYWADFIPFAHGMRLFGQLYNDALKPEDPFEFIDLLAGSGLQSVERNRLLAELAETVRRDARIAACLREGDCAAKAPEFRSRLEAFIARFGDLSCAVTGGVACEGAARPLAALLLAMAARPPAPAVAGRRGEEDAARVRRFLDAFPPERRAEAAERLELARASYRLRDDDNIAVGRIEAALMAAVTEGRRRLAASALEGPGRSALGAALERGDLRSRLSRRPAVEPSGRRSLMPRQLVGQPAGPGIASGPARVVRDQPDLAEFAPGEILVCDAVDPHMTYVVPLASGVVERRGGMLIHGAIIAREYGLPCVTGVTDATALIRTGDALTVDGYLGIVTVGPPDALPEADCAVKGLETTETGEPPCRA